MNRTLPLKPSLNQLRNQAKDLLKDHRKGETSVCDTLRLLHRFSNASDADILAADLALHDAQFALALRYGFRSWDALGKSVRARNQRPNTSMVERSDGETVIRGLENVDWGGPPNRRSNSVIEATAAAMRTIGEDMPYEQDRRARTAS